MFCNDSIETILATFDFPYCRIFYEFFSDTIFIDYQLCKYIFYDTVSECNRTISSQHWVLNTIEESHGLLSKKDSLRILKYVLKGFFIKKEIKINGYLKIVSEINFELYNLRPYFGI